MSSNPGGLLRAALRGLAALPPPDSDSELLERYVASRDEAAFAALVRRHGPMVLGVCRRRLGGGPDAEDAFQVAFMVLARDAKRIGRRESLPGWLYRVAYLVALKASGRRARHPAEPMREHETADRHDPHAEAAAGELRAALDAELSALPDKLRAVVVLCGLEQRTKRGGGEAARLPDRDNRFPAVGRAAAAARPARAARLRPRHGGRARRAVAAAGGRVLGLDVVARPDGSRRDGLRRRGRLRRRAALHPCRRSDTDHGKRQVEAARRRRHVAGGVRHRERRPVSRRRPGEGESEHGREAAGGDEASATEGTAGGKAAWDGC